jgi:hypothetical protein
LFIIVQSRKNPNLLLRFRRLSVSAETVPSRNGFAIMIAPARIEANVASQ